MSKKPKSKKWSIRTLAAEFNVDRATATRVCEGVKSAREARAALTTWSQQRDEKTLSRDPETGLSWWQARLREQVIQSRAGRDREKQLAGGELVPAGLIEKGAEQVGFAFDKLANSMYFFGIPLDEKGRAVVDRLAREAKSDFQAFIRQSLARAAEIRKEQGEQSPPLQTSPKAGPSSGDSFPKEQVLGMLKIIAGEIEQVPGKAKAELALTDGQHAGLSQIVDATRTQIADKIEALGTAEKGTP